MAEEPAAGDGRAAELRAAYLYGLALSLFLITDVHDVSQPETGLTGLSS